MSANVTQVRRRKAGLCPHCGGPPRAGRWLCENCAQRQSISTRKYLRKRFDAGLCIRCPASGIALARHGKQTCVPCGKREVQKTKAALERRVERMARAIVGSLLSDGERGSVRREL